MINTPKTLVAQARSLVTKHWNVRHSMSCAINDMTRNMAVPVECTCMAKEEFKARDTVISLLTSALRPST